jgi:pimeloyl-ACP methyl ester carboxylesterase
VGALQVVNVDGIPMSALVRETRQPRAVVVALHGGAATSTYFDYPAGPRQSLLATGAALGFTVIALDRPGYGRSAPYADTMTSPARRVDLAYAAVDRLLASGRRGAGVFLMAHSIGCELAVRMASDARGGDLLGIEIAGTGREYQPRALEIMETWKRARRASTGLRDMLWQPAHLYPADVVGGAHMASPAPAYEGAVAEHWTRDFPRLAPQVRVPVHYSLGDHEMVWRAGPPALADVAAMFTAAPRVAVHEQAGGGHNVSLGLTATAYHLTVLSFVEECVVAREHAESAS